MYCPNDECPDYISTGLRPEYRDGITTCPLCHTTLVPVCPTDGPGTDETQAATTPVAASGEMEPVIEATDLTEVAVIKSVLEAAGIPYIAHGEDRFSAFRGSFVGGSIFNSRSRGVIFTVPSEVANDARALLEEFEEGEDQIDDRG